MIVKSCILFVPKTSTETNNGNWRRVCFRVVLHWFLCVGITSLEFNQFRLSKQKPLYILKTTRVESSAICPYALNDALSNERFKYKVPTPRRTQIDTMAISIWLRVTLKSKRFPRTFWLRTLVYVGAELRFSRTIIITVWSTSFERSGSFLING